MSFSACGCESAWIGPSIDDICSGSQYVAFMTLVDLIIRYACDVSDPCGRIVPKLQPDPEYDFIVIGAGSGGSTAAGRLAEVSGWKILLLEAGMDEPPATQVPAVPAFNNTILDWNYTTTETTACLSNGGICTWPRGKVLGGSSVFNGMMYTRGTKADYDRWVAAGNTEWSLEKLIPVFKYTENNTQIGSLVSEEYHGTGGPLTIERYNEAPELAYDILTAAKQTGFPVSDDLNGDKFLGFAIPQFNTRDGVRLSLAKAFVRPHKDNPNFHVMLNSTVTKIIISEINGTKRASAVEFVYGGQKFTVNVSKEVILSAGAIATPQILLLSGIGDKAVLDEVGIEQVHNLTGVGKGIKNHVSFYIDLKINEPNYVDLNNVTLDEYLKLKNGPLSSTGLGQLTGRLWSNYTTPDDPDIQIFFKGYVNTCAYTGAPDSPVDPSDPDERRTVRIAPVVTHSKSSGTVSLASSNPFDKPKIVANYLTHPDDMKVLISGLRHIQRLLQAPILIEKYNATWQKYSYGNCSSQYEYDTDEFWDCAIRYDTYPENHQGCSCKMGLESDPETCVNQRLQLHGIPNIRIADASPIVDLPSANVQGIILAIAERSVLYIKEQYLGIKAF
ncbi:glucose dehydrogenase [FAD, quinone]-like [Sitophilus oryzae]|uniref:Glucose dehydrogenase [FAD, quinone]-like n=1 Tax=Sitophilus oryzae TaxID=7048 RepID=A0A6J2Y489_SITOR|nr:glucose dehydrogenase [FAD, quinone]-like [Sitophilus oryzae]XP_030758497.1 glucose dehydrogenase [FAD, quinone]-like [Sitophilus oryzae]XP_030758499.1 glucose dehydrogenase [FAD, quinone]-like [Sitophilus oryzae]